MVAVRTEGDQVLQHVGELEQVVGAGDVAERAERGDVMHVVLAALPLVRAAVPAAVPIAGEGRVPLGRPVGAIVGRRH